MSYSFTSLNVALFCDVVFYLHPASAGVRKFTPGLLTNQISPYKQHGKLNNEDSTVFYDYFL